MPTVARVQLCRAQPAARKRCESIGCVAFIVPWLCAGHACCRGAALQPNLDASASFTARCGLAAAAVLQEDFPLAYYGLRYQDRHHKYKYIETPGGW